jgi:hypothetical protein
MKMQILFVILFTFIIKESLSDGAGSGTGTISIIFKVDLKKYEKVTVPSSDLILFSIQVILRKVKKYILK